MEATDFRRGLGELNIKMSDQEFSKMWEKIDTDGSGGLDYYEFLDAFYPEDGIQKIEAPEMNEMSQDEVLRCN